MLLLSWGVKLRIIENIRLGDIAKVISGFAFKSSEFSDEGVPVVKIANIRAGFLDLDGAQRVNPSYLEKLADKYKVKSGDVLISLTGSHITQPNSVVGRVARASESVPACLLNQRAGKVILNDKDRCDLGFLYYYLTLASLRGDIAAMASGAASQANVSPAQVETLSIDLPPRDEQIRVSSILSAYDDLIETNTRRIEILEEMARRLYEEWFVRFRFPAATEIAFRQCEFGDVPVGWEEMALGDAVNVRKGKNITKSKVLPGCVPVVAGGLTPAYYHSTSNTKPPVITISASGANAGYVNFYGQEVWASDCSYIDAGATKFICYYYLLLKSRQDEITRLQRGSAQPHVYSGDVMSIRILDVPVALVEKFENVVSPLFQKIHVLLRERANLLAQRELLLPKLISGEIDVSDIPMPT